MRAEQQTDPHIYRIGAVSRLTSIPSGTIRVWERRYGVVEPGRSDGGFRLYSHRDVERLRVIKALIENGETIGGLAALDLPQLRSRLQAHGLQAPVPLQHPLEVEPHDADLEGSDQPANDAEPDRDLQGPLRVVSIGQSLPMTMQTVIDHNDRLESVGTRAAWQGLVGEIAGLRPDLLVVEQSSVHTETADELRSLAVRSGARQVVVIYFFGSEAALRALESARVTLIKGPLSPAQLEVALRPLTEALRVQPAPPPRRSAPIDAVPPPPRFDPETAARIVSQAKEVRCECPQHLVSLISSLTAFEAYSRDCEHRNEDDAVLHERLERAAGQARATLEDALEHLLQVENIEI